MIDRTPTCSFVNSTAMCSVETVPPAPLASWRPHRPALAQPPLPHPPSPRLPPAADRALLVARPWAQTILEALNGRRSWDQLADLFDPGQVNDIAAAAKACGFRGATLVGVRAQSPADGVVEATVTFAVAPKVRAAAFSLLRGQGRWFCSALAIG